MIPIKLTIKYVYSIYTNKKKKKEEPNQAGNGKCRSKERRC